MSTARAKKRRRTFCKHDAPIGALTIDATQRVIIHRECGRAVRCELCRQAATAVHVDYVVCDKHLGVAINNVADRRT